MNQFYFLSMVMLFDMASSSFSAVIIITITFTNYYLPTFLALPTLIHETILIPLYSNVVWQGILIFFRRRHHHHQHHHHHHLCLRRYTHQSHHYFRNTIQSQSIVIIMLVLRLDKSTASSLPAKFHPLLVRLLSSLFHNFQETVSTLIHLRLHLNVHEPVNTWL